MHILIIKTSSLGDVIHTLPALTDAQQHDPHLRCDWVVEENFAEIPRWHAAVSQVIPVAWRRWRRQLWATRHEWRAFKQVLSQRQYDLIIDAQGLLKSAVLTVHARGIRCGLDWQSAREPLATCAYQQRYRVPRAQHAVTRLRQLFAQILDYPVPDGLPDYGIAQHFPRIPSPTLVFLHGTTWSTKHYPEVYWQELAQRAVAAGYTVRLPWGNALERERAERWITFNPSLQLIPRSDLAAMAVELRRAQVVIGVDTGLAHLATALDVPTVTLYGATQPALTGTFGRYAVHVAARFTCAPCLRKVCGFRGETAVVPACYQELTPSAVWSAVDKLC